MSEAAVLFDNELATAAIAQSGKKIWAIGGGKGGVGKSFIASSLGISLARAGRRVVIVDLDLGSANLHTCLGSDIPHHTLSDFFAGRAPHLEALINKTDLPNLQFISGANDAVGAANISLNHHQQLLKSLLGLSADYIIFDLGAGTHQTTLDYFLLAHKPIVTMTPEPTSIENAYRFIKSAFFRWLRRAETHLALKPLVEKAMDHKNELGIRTPQDLTSQMMRLNPQLGAKFKEELDRFELFIVMNQVRSKSDVDTGFAVKSVCKKYFGIESNYVGYLDYDNAVWQAVRKRRPLLLEYPYSHLVTEFTAIMKNLDGDERHPRANLLRTP